MASQKKNNAQKRSKVDREAKKVAKKVAKRVATRQTDKEIRHEGRQLSFGKAISELRSAEASPYVQQKQLKIENKYLRSLLDPIGTPPMSYPDEFTGQTSCFKGLINLNMPYSSADVTSDTVTWKAGRFAGVLQADMQDPFIYLASTGGIIADFTGVLHENGPGGFIAPVRNIQDLSIPPPDFQGSKLVAFPGINYNICMPLAARTSSGVNFPRDNWMFHGKSGDEEFFGWPHSGPDGYMEISFNVIVTGNATTINVKTVSPGGTGTTQPVTVSVPGTYTVPILVANQRTCLVPPGVGFQFNHNGIGPMELSSVAIVYGWKSTSTKKVAWQTARIPDFDISKILYTRYRVVSACALLSYRGPTIQNAGALSCIKYEGGSNAGIMNFIDYDTIATVPGSYEGPITNGVYAIWSPKSTKDMQFREHEHETSQYPYICFSGQYKGDGSSATVSTDTLRLRVALNYECITRSQVVPQFMSRLDIDGERERALAFLHDFKSIMENPLHLENIADALRSAIRGTFSGIGAASRFYKKNKSWINPMLSAAVTGASLLL